MSAFLYLSSSSSSLTSLQFHSFSVIRSHANPYRFSPKTFELINPGISLSPNPSSQPNASITKMRTAPWMRSPVVLEPHEIVNPSRPKTKKNFEKTDGALTGKESGVRGKKAMKKIIQNIEKFQKDRLLNDAQKNGSEKFDFKGCFETSVTDEVEERGGFGGKVPWLKEERFVFRRMKKQKVVSEAEMSLDKDFLERLRDEARKMRKWVKVKKAGVTDSVIFEIRLAWRRNDLSMVKFDVLLCRNMDRARECLEMKTRGLVSWTKKDTRYLQRGRLLFGFKIFQRMEKRTLCHLASLWMKILEVNQ